MGISNGVEFNLCSILFIYYLLDYYYYLFIYPFILKLHRKLFLCKLINYIEIIFFQEKPNILKTNAVIM